MVYLKYRLFDGGNKKEIEVFLGSMAKVGNITGEGNERYLPVYHVNDWNFIPGKEYVRLKKNYYVIKIERTWAVVQSIDDVIKEKARLRKEANELEIRRFESVERLRNQHSIFEWNS